MGKRNQMLWGLLVLVGLWVTPFFMPLTASAAELITGEQVPLQLEGESIENLDTVYRTPSGGYYLQWLDFEADEGQFVHYREALVNADGSLLWQGEYAKVEWGDEQSTAIFSYRDEAGWVQRYYDGPDQEATREVARDWRGRKRWDREVRDWAVNGKNYMFTVGDWLLTRWDDRGEITIQPLHGGAEQTYPFSSGDVGLCFVALGDRLALLSEEVEGRTTCRFFDQEGQLVGEAAVPFDLKEMKTEDTYLDAAALRGPKGEPYLLLRRMAWRGRHQGTGTCWCWTLPPGKETFEALWEIPTQDEQTVSAWGRMAVIGPEQLLTVNGSGELFLLTGAGVETVEMVGAKGRWLLPAERAGELPVLILQDSEGTLWAQEVLGAERDSW